MYIYLFSASKKQVFDVWENVIIEIFELMLFIQNVQYIFFSSVHHQIWVRIFPYIIMYTIYMYVHHICIYIERAPSDKDNVRSIYGVYGI